MGKQLDETIKLINAIREEDKEHGFNGIAGTLLTTNNLLSNIAVSLAIIADESVKRNDMLIKLEGMDENEMEYATQNDTEVNA